MSANGVFDLTTTPRASTITALDTDIESSTLITINRKSPNFTHTLRYNFKALSGVIVDKTNQTNVGWTIPTTFYAQIPNEIGATATIYCDTFSGNTLIGTTQTNIGIDVNGKKSKPLINNVDIVDTNKTLPTGLTTTALTGSNQKLIKYISDVKGTINAVARNSATLVYFVFRNENDKIGTGAGNVYTLKDIQNSHFVILVKDSRGLAAIENKDLQMVDYIRLNMSKFSLKRESPTSNKVFLNVEGNWFNGNFGTATNTLQAILKYREAGAGAYTTIQLKLNIAGNTFKLNDYQIVSDFDYQKNYEFIIEIRDKCMIQQRTQIVQKGIPVFDYGENDFRINGLFRIRNTDLVTTDWIDLKPYLADGFSARNDQPPAMRVVNGIMCFRGEIYANRSFTSNFATILQGLPFRINYQVSDAGTTFETFIPYNIFIEIDHISIGMGKNIPQMNQYSGIQLGNLSGAFFEGTLT